MSLHRLLEKQLKKSFGDTIPGDESFQKFVQLINDAYEHHDNDRQLIERSMELSSEELMKANKKLYSETQQQKQILQSLKDAVSVLLQTEEAFKLETEHENEYILELANYLKKLAQDQKSIEEQYKRAAKTAEEANQAKTSFMSSISHELRTPLNAIIGFAQILKRDDSLPPQKRAYVETMHNSGIHLLDMINDILDISKIESGKLELIFEPFQIQDMLRNLEAMFRPSAEEKKLDLHIVTDNKLPQVIFSDGKRIQQILINLIGNAIKYTSRGSVTVAVRAVKIPKTSSYTFTFQVKDTGRGIPKSQLETIFEPFRQVKGFFSEGTGLGLAITKKIAELLEGRIEVESKFTQGSTFQFIMTAETVADDTHLERSNNYSVIGTKGDKKWRCLIVDDIQSNRAVARALLENIDIECIETDNGEDVQAMTRMFRPDFILMDIMMPGVDGKEATRRIRNDDKLANTKIIALTASISYNKREELLTKGFDDFIPKPFREHWIFESLENVVGIAFEKVGASKTNNASKRKVDPHLVSQSEQWLHNLKPDIRKKLMNAIEIQDFKTILRIIDHYDLSDDISTLLTKKAMRKDNMFFLAILDEMEI